MKIPLTQIVSVYKEVNIELDPKQISSVIQHGAFASFVSTKDGHTYLIKGEPKEIKERLGLPE